MKCTTVKLGEGFAIMCGRRPQVRNCSTPHCKQRAPLLCDYPRPDRKSGTCDRPLCAHHAIETGPNRHQCPDHPRGQQDLPL